MDGSRTAQIQSRIEPILADQGLELVELICSPRGGQLQVRLLVDRVGGVTIQQCARANQLIGEALESETMIPGSYTIEVSSPGLDRPLTTKRDFERAIGEDVRVTVEQPGGRFQELEGMLLAVQPEAVVLKTSGGNLTASLAQIRGAKKVIRW